MEKTYKAEGIVVGKQTLPIHETVLQIMHRKGLDSNTVRSYVLDNRHNSMTAYYYLLKHKIDRDPS